MDYAVFVRYMPRTVAEMTLAQLSSGKGDPIDLDVFGVRRDYHVPGFSNPVGYTRIFDEGILDEADGMRWVDLDVLTGILRKKEGARELISFDREHPIVNFYFVDNKPFLFCAYPEDWRIARADALLRENPKYWKSACGSYAEAPKTRDVPDWISAAGDDEGIPGDFFAASTEELIRLLAKLESYPSRKNNKVRT